MRNRVQRVDATDAARVVLRRLIEQHGPVLFHLSDAGRDEVSPMCFPVTEFRVDVGDVMLGNLPWHTEFWVGGDQYPMWRERRLEVDVVDGRGSSFSLEAAQGCRFVVRSRPLTEEEQAVLEALPPLRTGADPLT